MNTIKLPILLFLTVFSFSCKKEGPLKTDWERWSEPVFRDHISTENYQVASDAHVFFDENGDLKMIYSGDGGGEQIGIKLASGTAYDNWEISDTLLNEPGPSSNDTHKETAFYRLAENGKHQIFYIGYAEEETYEAEIYLAEADSLNGPYTQFVDPVIPKGEIAGKSVYCMTSPSIVEHEGLLYMTFIGWNDSPSNVTEVWCMGATSADDGYTWTDFQIVPNSITMEGQITKAPDGSFYAVSTEEYKKNEGIFLKHSNHPFGPWEGSKKPVLLRAGGTYEKDEIIAPQLLIDSVTNEKYIFYTGADHAQGWWIMLAKE